MTQAMFQRGTKVALEGNRRLLLNVAKQVGIEKDDYINFESFVNNNLASRRDMVRLMTDPRRDINHECGFPNTITPEMYQHMFDRQPIAFRSINLWPLSCWQVYPQVYELEKKTVTEFEKRWKDFIRGLAGRKSYFADEQGSLLWSIMKEAHTKSLIGQYGVLLLGLDDDNNGDFENPVTPKDGMKVAYIQTFSEVHAKIDGIVDDMSSPRHGQPEYYLIKLGATNQQIRLSSGISGGEGKEVRVHYTRTVHLSTSHVYHVPELQQEYNNHLGLEKMYGGSPEMYWKGAFPGLSLETDPSLGGDTGDIDIDQVKDRVERYMEGLERYLALNGFTAKSLSPQVVDPTPQIKVQLDAIAIKKGCPMRKFTGTEVGQLASTQDEDDFDDKIREYQNNTLTPRYITPLVDHLIYLGVLPTPQQDLHVYWPDLKAQLATERATIAFKESQAITLFLSGGGRSGMTLYDFFTQVMRWPEAVAQLVVDNISKENETKGKEFLGSSLLSKGEGVKNLIELLKLAKEGGLSEDQMIETLTMFYGMDEKTAKLFAKDIEDNVAPTPVANPLSSGNGNGLPGNPTNPSNTAPLDRIFQNGSVK